MYSGFHVVYGRLSNERLILWLLVDEDLAIMNLIIEK